MGSPPSASTSLPSRSVPRSPRTEATRHASSASRSCGRPPAGTLHIVDLDLTRHFWHWQYENITLEEFDAYVWRLETRLRMAPFGDAGVVHIGDNTVHTGAETKTPVVLPAHDPPVPAFVRAADHGRIGALPLLAKERVQPR